MSSSQRTGAAPEVPTVAEVIKDPHFDLTLWQGFFAPRNTPKEIVDKLAAEFSRIIGLPEIREKLLSNGMDPFISTPGQFAAQLKAELALYAKVVTTPGIYTQGMLIDQLQNVQRMVTQADQKVGKDAYDRYNDLVKEMNAIEAELKKLGSN